MQEKYISERRLIKRLVTYWERMKGDDILPNIEKFNSLSIGDIWDFCFIIATEKPSFEKNAKNIYKYEAVGLEVQRAYGENPIGEIVSPKIKTVPGGKIIKQIDKCFEDKVTAISQGQFINKENKIIKYRSCIIPFGKKDGTGTHAIVGLSWRSF